MYKYSRQIMWAEEDEAYIAKVVELPFTSVWVKLATLGTMSTISPPLAFAVMV